MAPEETPPGPDGQKVFVASVRGQVPGLRIAVDDVIAEGDRVAVRWTATFEPAPGERESYPGADILRLEDGRIAELWSFVP
jgi:predicted SnoaL-like aldol condensation-catalyzing enzyme